mgnify:FL=1
MFPTKFDLNIQNLEDSNCSPFKMEASILVQKFDVTSSETLAVGIKICDGVVLSRYLQAGLIFREPP